MIKVIIMSDTIAAIATGFSVSAIGIVRVSGDRALEYASRLFAPFSGKSLAECEERKLIYGRLNDVRGETLDLCLCAISRAPASYTGEDTAEFQCHGSPVILRAVLDELGGNRSVLNSLNSRCSGRLVEIYIVDEESAQCIIVIPTYLSHRIKNQIEEVKHEFIPFTGNQVCFR